MWQPPPAENLNGRLRYYTVWYRERETSLHSFVSTNNTSFELIDLHPYFTYIIKVRAETISPGPFSAEQSVQLEEDGMLLNECIVFTACSCHAYWDITLPLVGHVTCLKYL